MPGRALLMVNRRARRGAASLAEAARELTARGLALAEAVEAGPEEIAALVGRWAGEVDRVVVGGGDGTLGGAVGPLLEAGLPLAVLPLGTANNLARTLGIPASLPDACAVAAGDHRRPIDVGEVNGTYFFTTASLGLSVAITQALTAGTKRRWGSLAYALAAARVIARSRPFRAVIEWDGRRRRAWTVQVVVGNGRYYGSAMAVAEDATIDDAWLDLYSLEVRGWWRLLALAPALKRGRHGEKEGVTTVRAREITVRTSTPRRINTDGELRTTTPGRFRVLPRALAVFCPPPAP